MKKCYVVNGAAHPGFGECTARTLINSGYKVIGLYELQDAPNAERMKREYDETELELHLVDCDNFENMKETISHIADAISGFVNACFVFDMEDVDQFDIELAERLLRGNYVVPLFLATELKKKMKKGGAIVIVTSTEAERGSYGGITYAASKAAVHNMVKSLACNWGEKDQIRVNAVAAGWVGGEMDTDGPFEVSMNITPLGRLGRPEEIANAIEFLLSDKASFVNAQVLIVDGGYLAVDDIAKYEFEESKK